MYVYNAAWFALAVVLTAVLAGATVWAMRNRGWRAALFAAGLTLLPMALYLTGTLRVIGVIADQVAGYFVGFAFSPAVWAGVILGGVGVALMLTASALKRRGIGGTTRAKPRTPRSAPSPGKPAAGSVAAKGDDPLAGMDDIESILRKHGIQ